MRLWIKFLLVLAVIALLVTALFFMGKLTLNVLSGIGNDAGERDPMFAEEEPTPTPSPVETENVYYFTDHSEDWDTSVQTPVDKTAEELGKEAQNQS